MRYVLVRGLVSAHVGTGGNVTIFVLNYLSTYSGLEAAEHGYTKYSGTMMMRLHIS